jgi:hypothetical protein
VPLLTALRAVAIVGDQDAHEASTRRPVAAAIAASNASAAAS